MPPRAASRHPPEGAALAVWQSQPGGALGLNRFMRSGLRAGFKKHWNTK